LVTALRFILSLGFTRSTDKVQDSTKDCGGELIKAAFGFNSRQFFLKLDDPWQHDVTGKRYGLVLQRRIIVGSASLQQEV